MIEGDYLTKSMTDIPSPQLAPTREVTGYCLQSKECLATFILSYLKLKHYQIKKYNYAYTNNIIIFELM